MLLAQGILLSLASCGQDPGDTSQPENLAKSCSDDLQCWGNKAVEVGAWKCKREVEKDAVGDVRWTDGFGRPPFMRIGWDRKAAKLMTIIGDEVQFQNRFGAYINMTYSCVVDIYGQEVVSHSVHEGRLPSTKSRPPN